MKLAVRKGQTFAAARNGAPQRHVRIVGVALHRDQYGDHPVASVREVTRSGRPKGRKSDAPVRVFLVSTDGQWAMPPGYEEA